MRNENERLRVVAGVGSGWITLIKVGTMFFTAAAAVIGSNISDNMGGSGLVGLFIGLGVGLFAISSTMILLNAAQNIEQTTTNTAAQYEKMKQIYQEMLMIHVVLNDIKENKKVIE